jgi:hypothetical protein
MNTDLERFMTKIKNREPFAVIRPADGEYLVCTNQTITNIDNWTFYANSCLKDDLFASLKECEKLEDVYVGIPCKDCSSHIYNWYTDNIHIPSERLTYANIFCNKNWKSFTNMFVEEKRPFYYIGPYVSNKYDLFVQDVFKTDKLLVNSWDSQKEYFLASLLKWIEGKQGIFLFSVGPISKIVIPMLWKRNSRNIYLDVGSSFDLFMKESSNRGYIHDNNDYAKTVCNFKYGHKETHDITAVLTLYKRPHRLLEQIEALRNQTRCPKNIIVVKNYAEGIELPNLPNDIVVVNSSKNFGIWTRFAISLLADTKYVCVFDDDTIPGKRWFENCLDSMNIREGLYGTIGIRFPSSSYSFSLNDRVGWDRPNTEITQVDIVGHAWFFQRNWLHYLWQYTPDYNSDLKCAEDINFSFELQKAGIPTLVPPHPPGQYELYGSIPEKAWNYGCDQNAISGESAAPVRFENALQIAIQKGFKLLCMN